MTEANAQAVLGPQEMVDQALALSSADGCVVVVQEHTEANLRWASNSLTTNGTMQTRSVTVVSTLERGEDTYAGVVTRSITTAAELADLVRESEQAARESSPADDAVALIEPYDHADEGWGNDPQTTGVEVFERFAPELGAAFGRWSKGDRLLYGFAEHQMTSYFVATSTGLRRRFDQPDGRLELNGKSADLSRSAWSGTHSEDFGDIDVAALTDALDVRLDWAARRTDLPAGRYETLLPPTAVADLMIYAYWTASARDADEGRSVFAGPNGTRLGEQLTPLPLSLYSDPSVPGLRCPDFDITTQSEGGLQSVFDNGVPLSPTRWIDSGSLSNLARTRSWAAKSGTEPTPFVGNLILERDDRAGASLDEMVANTERGLLLTCLWYIREVDPQTLLLTGLTRDGVYLVENGAVTGAVNNFRFNESPIDLLRRAAEAGRSEHTLSREWSDYFSRTAMPALRIPDFNMSTVSKAS
jgi:predicted Zn-dependent protease